MQWFLSEMRYMLLIFAGVIEEVMKQIKFEDQKFVRVKSEENDFQSPVISLDLHNKQHHDVNNGKCFERIIN